MAVLSWLRPESGHHLSGMAFFRFPWACQWPAFWCDTAFARYCAAMSDSAERKAG